MYCILSVVYRYFENGYEPIIIFCVGRYIYSTSNAGKETLLTFQVCTKCNLIFPSIIY